MSTDNNEMTLEQMLLRLDKIAAELDSELPLEKALELYEEGVSLIKKSNAKISEAQAKIRLLSPDTNEDEANE